MKVAFLHDDPGYVGGAELTMKEFATSAPESVEWVTAERAETIVIGNSAAYGPEMIETLEDKRVIRYFNDLDVYSNPEFRSWVLDNAEIIFTSPLHRDRFPHEFDGGHIIPPAMDLDAFRPTRQQKRNGHRSGTVSIGAWRNASKGQQLLGEWAAENGPVDVYGGGPFVPQGGNLIPKGELAPQDVAQTLWEYERFVFLPFVLEPFGRCVVEAWAAGCELVINRLVGARYYLTECPERLESAASDFWEIVSGVRV